MTTDNPYQSPESLIPSAQPLDGDSDGLWRDGKLLVMRNQNPRFPARCVKTNEPCSGPLTRMKLSWLPNQTMWVLLFGAIGHSVAMATQGKKIWVELPLSDVWLAKRRRATVIGWSLLLGGIGCLVLGTVGYVALTVSTGNEASTTWIMFVILGGPIVAIVGVFWLVIFQQPALKAHEITDGLAWIKDVHPAFLESLPEWPWRESRDADG